METVENWYRRTQALLFQSFILFEKVTNGDDVQHFHPIQDIQRHSKRQLPDQVSVDDGIRPRA